ncbi:hypothetical protein POSPLADRAFT_1041336 [Postia placenta MAD-698-R-SB12]|uniref:Uncharacterized protein n=1 Tax=Postia placenta MAD-698-R-SB12 TaxID=670580 RepID=A0A1X6MQK4_9APHY|nr:hypothetical protein POSPLADRAFT_1041336 [Postia placenta MAD-698-R-SB12]OSX58704.1 hypothetical protein POSPLADRAFT_1041336 [Postia placenta MAD-698-R-SB12]
MLCDLGPPTCGASSESGSRAVVPRPGFGVLEYAAVLDVNSNQSCIKAPEYWRHPHTNNCSELSLASSVVIALTSSASVLATTGRMALFLLRLILHIIIEPIQRLTLLLRLMLGSKFLNLMSRKRTFDRMVWLNIIDF